MGKLISTLALALALLATPAAIPLGAAVAQDMGMGMSNMSGMSGMSGMGGMGNMGQSGTATGSPPMMNGMGGMPVMNGMGMVPMFPMMGMMPMMPMMGTMPMFGTMGAGSSQAGSAGLEQKLDLLIGKLDELTARIEKLESQPAS